MKHQTSIRTSILYLSAVIGFWLSVVLPLPAMEAVEAVEEQEAGAVAAEVLAVEGTACTSNPQTITYGSLTTCTLVLGDNHTYFFSARDGETVYVQVTRHTGGNPYFCLTRPGGTSAGCTTPLPYQSVSLTVTVGTGEGGTWSIRVQELGNDATMDYALSLERVAPPSVNATQIENADLLADEINPVGDNDLFYFNVCGASTWYVQATRLDGGNPQFCLYRPDGTLAGCTTALPYQSVSLTHTADQTEAYTIRVLELGNDATMSYNVSLACLAGDCRNDCGGEPGCFESGTGATYMKVCVSRDGTIEEFQSPAGYEQLAVADNLEGYALCSGTGLVHAWDAGLDEAGFAEPAVTQPGGPGTLPLTIKRTTTDGVFELTQTYARDTTAKDFTVTMAIKNLSAATVKNPRLARYFNGDIDNTNADDLYDRTLDSVWGTEGPTGHGLGLFAKSGVAHTVAVEFAANWDPLGGGTAGLCEVTGVTPTVPGDYAGRITYKWASILPGTSKAVPFLYRRQ